MGGRIACSRQPPRRLGAFGEGVDAFDHLAVVNAETFPRRVAEMRGEHEIVELAEGVIHVEQPREAIAALGVHLGQRAEPLRLAALHVMTTLTGSALLALAVDFGELDAETAWNAAHVDEDFQAEQWGQDSEALARRANRRRDMMAAAAVIEAIRP